MTLRIVAHRNSLPEEHGFLDRLYLFECEMQLLSEPCRTTPNWRTPWLLGGRPWHMAYGVLAEVQCGATVVEHKRFGKCLLLNDGKDLPAVYPNPRRGGKKIIGQLFIHSAQSNDWPGSAGCVTMQPVIYQRFIETLRVNENLIFELVDHTKK